MPLQLGLEARPAGRRGTSAPRTRRCSRPAGTRPAARRAASWRTRPGCGSSRASGPGRTCGRGSGRTGAGGPRNTWPTASVTSSRNRCRATFAHLHAGQLPRPHPQEADGDEQLRVGRVDLVAGDLLADEPVVRLVGVEAADDVVAVAPGVAALVVVGEARTSRRSGPRRASAGPSARRSAATRAAGRRPSRRRVGGPGRRRRRRSPSGVGGRPVRSNVTRRMSVRRSAGGAAARPTASSRDARKASIGLLCRSARPVGGGAGTPTGLPACTCGSSSRDEPAARANVTPSVASMVAPAAGHSAPAAIQRRINSTCSPDSLSFSFGGIAETSAVRRTARYSRLSSGLSGTMAALPLSPPRRAASRVRRSSPPRGPFGSSP